MQKKIKILAIPGSLRPNSSNHKIINAIQVLEVAHADMITYNDLGKLPHFDDREYEIVEEWRNKIKGADAVLLCMPEYAFGVPGSLKNALDWTVSSGEFYEKPVALITASSSGVKAHAAMQQTLTALSAKMTDETKLLISSVRSKFNEKGELEEGTLRSVQKVISALIAIAGEKSNE